jgi:hypothetical protein
VKAIDAATNGSTSPASYTWTTDTTAPSVSSVTVSRTTFGANGDKADVTFNATEAGTYSIRVGGSSCTTGTQTKSGSYTSGNLVVNNAISDSDLAGGSNTIRVCVTDASTNAGSATTSVNRTNSLAFTVYGPGHAAGLQAAAPTRKDLVSGRHTARKHTAGCGTDGVQKAGCSTWMANEHDAKPQRKTTTRF